MAHRAAEMTLQAADSSDPFTAFVAIAGPAIHEPVVQAGPFVMNSEEEAAQAFADYRAGKFGTVLPFQ